MCCFSERVNLVADTQIFARNIGFKQFLVYSMVYAAEQDLAMILPLPVPPDSAENAVRFISLKDYPEFFEDLDKGFPDLSSLRGLFLSDSFAKEKLQVHEVGDFEASFVPSQKDFNRLDERFRISPTLWQQLPVYQDYGFAVFKLKPCKLKATKVHPMAFEFPIRHKNLLFFPTVHIHDNQVHRVEEFNHDLYYQADRYFAFFLGGATTQIAAKFMKIDKAKGIIEPSQLCYRLSLEGQLENKDTLLYMSDRHSEVCDKSTIPQLDQGEDFINPISEADIYLDYNRYEQAEQLIKAAIQIEPNNTNLKAKLLEIFYQAENQQAFESYVSELYHSEKLQDARFWRNISGMAKEICSDSPLFELISKFNNEI